MKKLILKYQIVLVVLVAIITGISILSIRVEPKKDKFPTWNKFTTWKMDDKFSIVDFCKRQGIEYVYSPDNDKNSR